jgi:hypothetical protein
MRRATQELEPTVAAARALGALLEAAMYSREGMRTVGRRVGHRAAVARVEGTRRAGGAVYVLRGGVPPQRRSPGRFALAATVGGTVGAAAALAIRHGMVLRRTSTAGNGSTSNVVNPSAAPTDGPVADPDAGVRR